MSPVPPADHPFRLDVRLCAYEPGRYVWTIKRELRPPRNSTLSYASVDEARRFAKGEMDDLVADWRAVRDGGRAAVSRGIEAAQAGLTRSPERR